MSIEVEADDFGVKHYGINLYSHEDDWGWTTYGHPDRRRLLAAINSEARDNGVMVELHESLSASDLIDGLRRRWARPTIRTADGIEFEYCERDDIGAFPLTVVRP